MACPTAVSTGEKDELKQMAVQSQNQRMAAKEYNGIGTWCPSGLLNRIDGLWFSTPEFES
jgi:hypothetical protein